VGSRKGVSASELRGEVPKEIFDVLVELEDEGLIWLKRGGHKAIVMCAAEGCPGKRSVGGTPANPGNVAKRLRRWVSNCPEHR